MSPVAALNQVGHFVLGLRQKMAFYEAWSGRRAADGAVDHARMLEHPVVQQTRDELVAGWKQLRRLYQLDQCTWDALVHVLCAGVLLQIESARRL